MPRDVPRAFIVECQVNGAHVELVDGLITDAGRRVAAGREEYGWFDLSTLKEPYRVEGKKTMGYELAEQFAWELPQVIIYPTGGGTGLIGMWKSFQQWRVVTAICRRCNTTIAACPDVATRYGRCYTTAIAGPQMGRHPRRGFSGGHFPICLRACYRSLTSCPCPDNAVRLSR
jgi:threonine dehydratase